MAEHITDAIVVHCIDFRFQKYLDPWLHKHLGHDNYDRVSLAGAVFDFYSVLKQVEISDSLHKIKKVILINHEDCGAYIHLEGRGRPRRGRTQDRSAIPGFGC